MTNFANICVDASFFKPKKSIIFHYYTKTTRKKTNRSLRFLTNAFIVISDNRTKSPIPISGPSCSIEPVAICKNKKKKNKICNSINIYYYSNDDSFIRKKNRNDLLIY